jgi:DNA mismatch repair ATPase MutS
MPNSRLLQRQIKLNAGVLSGLHEEYNKLRAERKKYNEIADEFAKSALWYSDREDGEKEREALEEAKAHREQAAIFTPYIKRFKKKIAGLEEVQKALKHELKCQACLEAWERQDSFEWFNLDADGNVIWE